MYGSTDGTTNPKLPLEQRIYKNHQRRLPKNHQYVNVVWWECALNKVGEMLEAITTQVLKGMKGTNLRRQYGAEGIAVVQTYLLTSSVASMKVPGALSALRLP